jgi:uncharacterized protein YggE
VAEGPTLTVRGQATVAAEPDAVELGLTLTAFSPRADEAFGRVNERAAALSELLDELEIPRESRATVGFHLYADTDFDERGEPREKGYRAVSRTAVRLDDSSALAPLIRQAVARAGVGLDGPRWSVRAENPARLEACRRAAELARDRAGAYADALGLPLGPVVAAAEAGTEPSTARRLRSFAAIDNIEYPVESGELQVAAALDVTFALGAPGG